MDERPQTGPWFKISELLARQYASLFSEKHVNVAGPFLSGCAAIRTLASYRSHDIGKQRSRRSSASKAHGEVDVRQSRPQGGKRAWLSVRHRNAMHQSSRELGFLRSSLLRFCGCPDHCPSSCQLGSSNQSSSGYSGSDHASRHGSGLP